MALVNRAKPIEEIVQSEKTSPRLKNLLAEIPSIKAYGELHGLKPTANYSDYVQLDRPYVVYVVSACEELKFKPKQWNFWVVGSVPYLGWFDRESAVRYGNRLRDEGWDVDVRGASAYSTLGWFRDAVLSSMISSGADAFGDLVNVVLHESVHATQYVNGQSFYNESLASFVADQLTPVYLRQKRGEKSEELTAYLQAEADSAKRGERFQQAYRELAKLYDSNLAVEKKRSEKRKIFESLKKDLKIPDERQLGNSTLMQFRTYGTGREEFVKLLNACGGDWKRFWNSTGKITPKSFEKPQQEDLASVVLPLAEQGCK